MEGNGAAAVLRASLDDNQGGRQNRDINLSERIGNNDGRLEFSKIPPLDSACLYANFLID